MTFRQCIDNAEAEGIVPRQEAERLRGEFTRLTRALSQEYGPEAEKEAARRTFSAFAESALRKKRNKLKQARLVKRYAALQAKYAGLDGKQDAGLFMVNLIEDIGGRAGTSTVAGRYRAHLSKASSIMTDALFAFERDFLGRTRNIAALDNVVREAFGETSGDDAAKGFASSWNDASEYLRQRFNAAGGAIAKLEKWGLPQYHDAIAVARVTADDWLAYVKPRLNRARMIDRDTGAPLDDAKLDAVLRTAHRTISTQGWSKVTPSGAPIGRSLANAHLDSRVLHFNSADDWLAYQKKFGQGDAFAAMMAHLDEMARDIAQIEILGPNPGATMRFLEQNAKKIASERGDDAAGKTDTAHQMLGLFDGSLNAPVNPKFASFAAGVREFLVASQLGFASFSSVTDIKTQRIARRVSGIRSNAAVGDLLKTLNPADPEIRRIAVRGGLIADGAMKVGSAYARYAGDFNSRGLTRWLADTTLRWNGLAPMTQGHKWSFGMEFMGNAADMAAKSLKELAAGDDVEKNFARTLGNYQLAEQWETIRQVKPWEPRAGAQFLRADDIARDLGDDVALRWREMIDGQTKIAVPEAQLRGRAGLTAGKPGTVPGELLRSIGTYKSYPVSVTMNLHHLTMTEAMEKGGGLNGAGSAAMFLAQIITGLTLYGALAMQMKEIGKGRDPRSMNPLDDDGRTFWAQAMLQGGGLGIFGDFLSASTSRAGGSLGETLAGSPVGFVSDAAQLTLGNAAQALAGEETRLGREATTFARNYTPLGNVWWMSQAYQRSVLDNIQRIVDPDADAYFRRQSRSRRRLYGNGYYWAPGDTLPERAPDPAAIAGTAGS